MIEKTQKKLKIDTAIIGAGPAGLTAALYAARAGAGVIVFENGKIGGLLGESDVIENYPGFMRISGAELAEKTAEQATAAGAKIDEFSVIENVSLKKRIIYTSDCEIHADSIIIAAGVRPIKLEVPGAESLAGKGVHYCALCDGAFYKGKKVAVVGGGGSAAKEALYLAKIARRVIILRRKDTFDCEKTVLDSLKAAPNTDILYNTKIAELAGENRLEAIITESGAKIPADGLFVYIGSRPNTELFSEIKLDKNGYIITDKSMKTSLPGVFAAGDVRSKKIRQIITAAADGCIAGINAAGVRG
ncbi:MAG: FAD-dependent oxidoreductase [Ruminococcus sp.]|nr:FAD-dependent oxidoreductase [Ruminococcus sp.]